MLQIFFIKLGLNFRHFKARIQSKIHFINFDYLSSQENASLVIEDPSCGKSSFFTAKLSRVMSDISCHVSGCWQVLAPPSVSASQSTSLCVPKMWKTQQNISF